MDQHAAVRCLSFPRAGMGCEIELSHMNYIYIGQNNGNPNLVCEKGVSKLITWGRISSDVQLKFNFTAIREQSHKTLFPTVNPTI